MKRNVFYPAVLGTFIAVFCVQQIFSQITYRDFPKHITFDCFQQSFDGAQWNSVAYGVKQTYVYDDISRLRAILVQYLDSNLSVTKNISAMYGYRSDGLPSFVEWRVHSGTLHENTFDQVPFTVFRKIEYNYLDNICVGRLETEFDTISGNPELSKKYDYAFFGKDSVEMTFSVKQNNTATFKPQSRELYVYKGTDNWNHYEIYTSQIHGDSLWHFTHKQELWVDGFVDMENRKIQGQLIRSEEYDHMDIPEMEWQLSDRFQAYMKPESLWFDSCVWMKKNLMTWHVESRNTFQYSEEGDYIKEEYNYHDNGLLKSHLRQVYRLDGNKNMVFGNSETNINGVWLRTSVPNNVARPYSLGAQLYEVRYNEFADYIVAPQDAVSFVAEYVSQQVGDSPFHHEPAFSVYPNPTQGEVFVTPSLHKILRFEVVDTWGRIRLQKQVNNPESINISTLPNGLYFLKFHTATGCGIVKVVKQ